MLNVLLVTLDKRVSYVLNCLFYMFSVPQNGAWCKKKNNTITAITVIANIHITKETFKIF